MSLVLSVPLGIIFGLVTWAAVRGRGGLTGMLWFAFFGAMGSLAGGLAVAAGVDAASERVVALGATIGAVLASLTEIVAFGRGPRVA